MNTVVFHILWTVTLFILFIAIIFWAWSGKRKAEFDELAHLPLDEEKFAPRVEKNTSGRKDNA
jgi:cytochrome c oxidase cbb3-type subunit 4